MPADFYLQQLQPLVGAKIVGLARTDESDPDEYFGLVVELPNKQRKVIFFLRDDFLRDDEGNGSGSFEIQDAK